MTGETEVASEWRARAVCSGLDADMFFPERGDRATLSAAVAVCSCCPVRSECLEYALDANLKFGVWGGTSERRRRRLRRQRPTVTGRGLGMAS